MRALVLNCTLKSSPEVSNTEALARVVVEALEGHGVETELLRVVDYDVKPGVTNDEGNGDEWPQILEKLRRAEILVLATPTWMGQPGSVSKRVVERMDALLSETDEAGRPFAYNRVGGIVVTGNEDGAHHVIADLAQAIMDIGYTIPGQAWTYWNMGPGPGPVYLESDHNKEWSASTGRAAAQNLFTVAQALQAGGGVMQAPPE